MGESFFVVFLHTLKGNRYLPLYTCFNGGDFQVQHVSFRGEYILNEANDLKFQYSQQITG